MIAIGLMSGTSLDGVDACLVEIEGCSFTTSVKLINFVNIDIPDNLKKKIKKACLDEATTSEICSLNFELGYLFNEASLKVLEGTNYQKEDVDFIASHGQTIYHIPTPYDNLVRSTLQIGEASVIAYCFNKKVISNFRVMDIAAGGLGAPLVPHTEMLLYSKKDKNIALQNIGGIGNVTVLPGSQKFEEVYAFDTGPGNMIIDEVVTRLFNQKYDDGGKIASSGKVNERLLNEMMSHPYFKLAIPKTTGREMFGEKYVDELLLKNQDIKPEDIVATVTMFTAKTIKDQYDKFVLNKFALDEIIIGGGGAYNKALMANLKALFTKTKVLTQEDIGFSSDAKEAIAFAVLGNETLHALPSNVPNATGAKRLVVLGQITQPPYEK